jgi:acetyltransferase-like isoleucine patch superfamily enzyme
VEPLISPLAFVKDATIGAGTKVWQFASVIEATIGERCIISAGVFLGPGTLVGNDCFIGMSVSICNDMWPSVDKDGFDIEQFRAGKWAVIVGDGSTIGANAVILPGVAIGRGSFVAAGAVVDRNVPDGFLWRRNGYLTAMPENRRAKRMREARIA